MQNHSAVVVVSFGTSHLDTLEKNIAAIEQAIHMAFPDQPLYRAFTSGVIIKKLQERDGMTVLTVPEVLQKLEQDGVTHVLMQPTHIINGEEYHKLCAMAQPFAQRLELSIGTPLLTSVQDYTDTVAALKECIDCPAADEAVIFMGHGTEHHANASYALLEYMLHDHGMERVFIGTVEGYPSLPQVIKQLKKDPAVRRIRLQPLLIVAGDHAKNDMAGEDEDSWRCQLEQQGYEVSWVLRGLVEFEPIRNLFVHHARSAQ